MLRIVGESWHDAHTMKYSRVFMLFKSIAADFLRVFLIQPAWRNRALACALELDSGEDHGEFRGLEFDAAASGGARDLEGSGFESLVPEGQPISIKVEDLDPIPTAVDEEEEMAGQRVLSKALLDQSGETVKALRMSVAGSKGRCGRRRGA